MIRRNAVTLTYMRRTMSVSEWAEELGIRANVIRKRLAAGWPTDQALSTIPVKGNRREYAPE